MNWIKKHWKAVLVVILLGTLAFSLFSIWQKEHDYEVGRSDYSDAESIAKLPDMSKLHPLPERPSAPNETEAPEESKEPYIDPYADALRAMDFAALQEVNPEVLGWILIPNTHVSYPIVQGEDNRYYLNHTWRRSYSAVGAIFMECQNSSDFSDFHTLLYGHRMADSSMFHDITRYNKQSFYNAHPIVYITDKNGTRAYEVYAAYEAQSPGPAFKLISSPDSAKQELIDLGLEQSVISTGITPTVKDNILTLSTCTGRGHESRWIIQAVYRVEESEPEETPEPTETPPVITAVPEPTETETGEEPVEPTAESSSEPSEVPVEESPVSEEETPWPSE